MATPNSLPQDKARWYVVHVYAGLESKVAQAIKDRAAEKGMAHVIHDIVIPSEQASETRRGQKISVERTFFPGYILVNMLLSDESWHLVKNTPKVTGFIGGGAKGRPVPMAASEVKRLLNQMQEGFTKTRTTVSYETGEQVRVIDGPFSTFSGVVEEVDEDKRRLKVSVSIFGRATPVELDYTQVEKL